MSKAFKKQNGKLHKTETITVESDYSRSEIVTRLYFLNEGRTEQVMRNEAGIAEIDANIAIYQELLAEADRLNVNE